MEIVNKGREKLHVWLPLSYLIACLFFLFIGLNSFSSLSKFSDFIFWSVLGLFTLPWSIVSAFVVVASTHADGYGFAKLALALGILFNSYLIHYMFKKNKP